MRHTFRFPDHIKEAVRLHVRRAVLSVNPQRFRQEPAYVTALIHGLQGVAYQDDDGLVSFQTTGVDSVGRGSAEKWSGADLAITATVRQGFRSIDKAILVQAKLGAVNELPADERERLIGQVRDMSRLTRSPKVMEIPVIRGTPEPRILSGTRLLAGKSSRGLALPEYVVARITTTLDGDTRPSFVDGVQESTLAQLRVHAEMREPDVLVPVPETVKVLA